MIRDRIGDLKTALGQEGEENGGGESSVKVEMDAQQANMDRFFSKVGETKETLAKMVTNVEQVKRLQSEVLSSSHTEEKAKLQLDDLAADIKRGASKVKAKLKEIEKEAETDAENISANERIKKTQHSALSRQFVGVMSEYNRIQGDYRDKCKGRIQRQLQITGRTTTDEELDEMLEQGNVEVFTQGILMETQQARQQLADIEERHAEIVKLEKSIKELYDLFVDMAVLVESQGEMVDNIESHVVRAQDYVETAKEQTSQAKSYQTKSRKKKIMIAVCLAVLLLVIILIIIFSV